MAADMSARVLLRQLSTGSTRSRRGNRVARSLPARAQPAGRPFDQDAIRHVTARDLVGSRGTCSTCTSDRRVDAARRHLEPGEAPWEAALRETWETGLPFATRRGRTLVHLDAHPAGAHFHLDLRYLLLSDDIDLLHHRESQHVRGLHLLRPSSLPTKLSWTASTPRRARYF